MARLRAADCTTIERVIAESSDRLAELMRISTQAAARFQREARNLEQRLGSEAIAVAPEPVAVRAQSQSQSKPNPLERVLSTWRARDEEESQAAEIAAAPRTPRARVPNAIAIGAVDGIDAETSAELARAGIDDIAALASCDALALARQTGFAYSRVLRLRALAKRVKAPAAKSEIADAPVRSPMPARAIKLSPAEFQPIQPEPVVVFERDYVLQPLAHEVDAGGPFA